MVVLFFIGLLFLASQIEKQGLKGIVTEIWNGNQGGHK